MLSKAYVQRAVRITPISDRSVVLLKTALASGIWVAYRLDGSGVIYVAYWSENVDAVAAMGC